MYRYVAFGWNCRDAAKTATAQRLTRLLQSTSPHWQSVLDVPGLRVLHAPQAGGACHAYVLKRDTGVVLGRLFHADLDGHTHTHDPTFDDRETDLLLESGGHRLVKRYWGHYVAFLREVDGHRRYVLRDPTGGLPCFLLKVTGIDVILSDMEDCVRLNLTPFSIDWDHITAFFLHCRLMTRTTGFKDVTQLYAGECAVIADDGTMTRSFYWNPSDVSRMKTIEDPDEARAALYTVIRYCVGAWCSAYDSIVLNLSGGLDSSIVAACLAQARSCSKVLCFHFFTETSEGDERAYARVAAHGAGLELIEREASVSERSLQSQLDPTRIATPAVQGFLPASELLRRRLTDERHAGAVFSGQGGDHLFQQDKTNLIAAEYAYRHGLVPQLLGVVRDTSRLTNESVWSVFGTAINYGLVKRPFDPYTMFDPPSILTDEARTSISPRAYEHPWVERASRLPAAKKQQMFHAVDTQVFYLQPCPYAEQVHPLISQPIIEHCLQIPSYILAHRGKARGLVREAFEANVPATIIHRYSKGATTSYFNRLLIENVHFIREFLLDGVLVNQGVLDRHAVEKQLSESELIRGSERRPILNAVRAEAWLSNWADAKQRTAA